MRNLRIGIDAMGGDFAPDAVVKGVVEAIPLLDEGSKVVLFGDKERIEELLKAEGYEGERVEIVATTEVITMHDHPAKAFQTKADSSIRVGFEHLAAKKIDGFASAGSTGAMMAGAIFTVGVAEGVIRPAISAAIANIRGGYTLLLDVGLNVDCKPEVLAQYALMGSLYAKDLWGLESPKVGLLNIGEEESKGNAASKAAHQMIAQMEGINFVGNIEGKDYFTGKADVIVCDGFMGNVLLKMSESLRYIAKARKIDDDFLSRLNYEIKGGTPALGVNGVVMVGHGSSTVYALRNMVKETELCIKAGYVEDISKAFAPQGE
ncbi:MAG: phosphate acyltransferase PlsX [Tidjanibacter sp.]|jgi:glycerol-3-phosphate acyltransferase PlsX|nr:phosphate acyltransferase PlsX [Tidjanibacter sp.]MBQ5931189.1 phosphate acyltransferase PlsX [Tidjanibacter sp.]